MSDTLSLLRQQVDSQARNWTLALNYVSGWDVDATADELAELAEKYDAESNRFDVLNTEALAFDLEWRGPNRSEATVTAVRITLCTGGPNVEIVAKVGQGAEVIGTWGSAEYRRHLDHALTLELASDLAELAEMV